MTVTGDGRPAAAVVVDAAGLRCPLPLIKAKLHAETQGAGTVFTLLATDPEAPIDIAAWCHDSGHELIAKRADGERIELDIRVGDG